MPLSTLSSGSLHVTHSPVSNPPPQQQRPKQSTRCVDAPAASSSSSSSRPVALILCCVRTLLGCWAGAFAGQRCYGYLSFEAFVEASAACNGGTATPEDYDGSLPTLATTAGATAILEAGRRSLDAGGQPMALVYADDTAETPIGIEPVGFGAGAAR